MGQSRLVISTIMPAMLVDYQRATLHSFCSSSNYFPILYCYFRQQISSTACFPEGVIKSFPRCQGADHRCSTGSDSEAPGLHLLTIQHAVWFGRQVKTQLRPESWLSPLGAGRPRSLLPLKAEPPRRFHVLTADEVLVKLAAYPDSLALPLPEMSCSIMENKRGSLGTL